METKMTHPTKARECAEEIVRTAGSKYLKDEYYGDEAFARDISAIITRHFGDGMDEEQADFLRILLRSMQSWRKNWNVMQKFAYKDIDHCIEQIKARLKFLDTERAKEATK